MNQMCEFSARNVAVCCCSESWDAFIKSRPGSLVRKRVIGDVVRTEAGEM